MYSRMKAYEKYTVFNNIFDFGLYKFSDKIMLNPHACAFVDGKAHAQDAELSFG